MRRISRNPALPPPVSGRPEFLRAHRSQDMVTRIAAWVLITFLILVIYDGAIRKWLLPGAHSAIFILKDAILFAGILTVVAVGRAGQSWRLPAYMNVALGLYAVWVLVQVANPHLPNMAVGVWGAKAHLLYAGLILLLPLAMASTKKSSIELMEWAYPWIVIPVCALAVLQVNSPADSFLNKQLDDSMEAMAFFGEQNLIRVSGTFSYLSGMASFQQVMGGLGIGLLLLGRRSPAFLAGLAGVGFSLPTTGSRGVIVFVAATAAVYLTAAILVGARVMRINAARNALAVIAVLAIVVLLSQIVVPEAWEALYERHIENQEEGEARVVQTLTDAFTFVDISGLTGFGSGAANFGAVALTPNVVPFSWLPIGQAFENEQGRIVLELGIVGFVLSMLLRFSILLWSCWALWFGRSWSSRAAGFLGLPFFAAGLYQGAGVFAHPLLAAAYWFFVALLAMAHAEDEALSRPRQRRVIRR